MSYVVNNHLNNLYVVSNKAVGPGKKNAKLITVGPTSIPDSRVSGSHESERSERIYISQYFFNHLEVKHLRDKKFCNNWKEYLKQNQIIFNFMNSNMKINHVFQQRFIYIPPLNALKLA